MKRFGSWVAVAVVGVAGAPLLAVSPASADITPLCERTLAINSVLDYEGTLSSRETAYWNWYHFTVTAGDCTRTSATAYFTVDHVTTDDADLVLDSGTLTWAAGDTTTRTVYVRVVRDSVDEPNERFVVKVCAGSGASGWVEGSGWVMNDDGITPPSDFVEYNYHCRQ